MTEDVAKVQSRVIEAINYILDQKERSPQREIVDLIQFVSVLDALSGIKIKELKLRSGKID